MKQLIANDWQVKPGIGHNIPPEEKRRQYCKAITRWVGEKRLGEDRKREELAHLEGLQRALALRNGTIVNLIRYCRRHPFECVRPAVLALITSMADNNDGVCRLA